jgi:hypothetical protein
MTRLLVALLVVGCGTDHSPAATPVAPAVRPLTARNKLPANVAPLVPQHGIYAAGGGLTSAPWRVVVDDDANTLFAGASKQSNAPSFGKLEKEQTQPLSPRNKDYFAKMADDAWREPAPAAPAEPTADYDEILIVCDGPDCFFLEGYGPIKRPAAAKLIEMLRAAGGL